MISHHHLKVADDKVLDLPAVLILPQPDDLIHLGHDPESVIANAAPDAVSGCWRSWPPNLKIGTKKSIHFGF
jgi:hypothetical protein